MQHNCRMFQRGLGRAACRCGLLLMCEAGGACGDPGDLEVPLPLSRATPEPGAPTSAVVVVDGSGSDAQCAFSVSLPSPDARRTLITGSGDRFGGSAETPVECRVHPVDPTTPDVFTVDLLVGDPTLPVFKLRGSPSLGEWTILELALTVTAESASVEALCSAETDEILPGAVWFPSFTCDSVRYNSMPVACQLDGGALFERCDR